MLTMFLEYVAEESQVIAPPLARSRPILIVPFSRKSSSSPRGPIFFVAATEDPGSTTANASATSTGRNIENQRRRNGRTSLTAEANGCSEVSWVGEVARDERITNTIGRRSAASL